MQLFNPEQGWMVVDSRHIHPGDAAISTGYQGIRDGFELIVKASLPPAEYVSDVLSGGILISGGQAMSRAELGTIIGLGPIFAEDAPQPEIKKPVGLDSRYAPFGELPLGPFRPYMEALHRNGSSPIYPVVAEVRVTPFDEYRVSEAEAKKGPTRFKRLNGLMDRLFGMEDDFKVATEKSKPRIVKAVGEDPSRRIVQVILKDPDIARQELERGAAKQALHKSLMDRAARVEARERQLVEAILNASSERQSLNRLGIVFTQQEPWTIIRSKVVPVDTRKLPDYPPDPPLLSIRQTRLTLAFLSLLGLATLSASGKVPHAIASPSIEDISIGDPENTPPDISEGSAFQRMKNHALQSP